MCSPVPFSSTHFERLVMATTDEIRAFHTYTKVADAIAAAKRSGVVTASIKLDHDASWIERRAASKAAEEAGWSILSIPTGKTGTFLREVGVGNYRQCPCDESVINVGGVDGWLQEKGLKS